MFRNRSIVVGVAKTPKREIAEENGGPLISIDPETVTRIRVEAQRIAIILGAIYAGKVLLNTASKVTIISMEAKLLK